MDSPQLRHIQPITLRDGLLLLLRTRLPSQLGFASSRELNGDELRQLITMKESEHFLRHHRDRRELLCGRHPLLLAKLRF